MPNGIPKQPQLDKMVFGEVIEALSFFQPLERREQGISLQDDFSTETSYF